MGKFKSSKGNMAKAIESIQGKPAKTCQWFLLCDNPAVTTEPHPILGKVPICRRCADKVAKLKA